MGAGALAAPAAEVAGVREVTSFWTCGCELSLITLFMGAIMEGSVDAVLSLLLLLLLLLLRDLDSGFLCSLLLILVLILSVFNMITLYWLSGWFLG